VNRLNFVHTLSPRPFRRLGARPPSGGLCFFHHLPPRISPFDPCGTVYALASRPVTYVYVDGFNLYYGALRGTPHRWLDIGAFCDLLLPKNDVRKVRYFTARVRPLAT
jgi:hypothetical protein